MHTVPKYHVGLKYTSEDNVTNGIIKYGFQSDFDGSISINKYLFKVLLRYSQFHQPTSNFRTHE